MACTVKIATAPCSWGVWWADGTPSGTPWNVFLDQAAEAGYTSLEMGPDGYLPVSESELRSELAARKLDICAGTACYQFDHYASFTDFRPMVEKLCKRLTAFNAPYLVTMDESDVGLYSEKKKDFAADVWKKYFAMFKALGVYTKEEFGIETVYHPHIKTLIETEDEIVRMMDACNLNLCFDTGHHAYVNGGTSPDDRSAPDFIKKYPERIKYLHLKNVDGAVLKKVRDEHLSSDTAFDIDVMCALDSGIINFARLKTVLDEINYNGIGVVESDLPTATTQEAFDMAKRNLQHLCDTGIVR
jgi:inosose dehydratase